MMLFLLPLYMLRRNPEVVGGAWACWPCAKTGTASEVPSNAIANSLFIMRAILPHDLADRSVLLVQQEDELAVAACAGLRELRMEREALKAAERGLLRVEADERTGDAPCLAVCVGAAEARLRRVRGRRDAAPSRADARRSVRGNAQVRICR